jgi:hypothetical protein
MSQLILKCVSLITVEPIMFLASFALGLIEAPNLWLYYEKVQL